VKSIARLNRTEKKPLLYLTLAAFGSHLFGRFYKGFGTSFKKLAY